MEKNYNSTRSKLFLPEYGRHIHEMIDYVKTIKNRNERTRQARMVIGVMGNLNPMLRDTSDITHKLWDHLFIMAGFDLDVDSPYPIPTSQELSYTPEKLEYPRKRMTFKHYGQNVENTIRSLKNDPNAAAVRETVQNIARYMRTKSYEYNQEHPNNEIIIGDIKRMSRGGIAIDEKAIGSLRSEYRTAPAPTHQKKVHNGGRNQRNGRQVGGRRRQQA
jgi:hypothetical protein